MGKPVRVKAIKPRHQQTVGLFGGSFNPAHDGHMMVAQCGLRQAGLDKVWWLVSPGNPLKRSTHNYDARVASVHALGLPPGMSVSHIETQLGTRYTIDLIRKLTRRYPQYKFVWMMGADNLAQLPKWKNWQEIMQTLPMVIIARPSKRASGSIRARLSQPARQYARARVAETQAKIVPQSCAPCWTYLTPPLNSLSSTKLRALARGQSR